MLLNFYRFIFYIFVICRIQISGNIFLRTINNISNNMPLITLIIFERIFASLFVIKMTMKILNEKAE